MSFPELRAFAWAALRGPLALEGRRARALGIAAIAMVTMLTQIGAVVVWPCLGLLASIRGRARAALALGGVGAYVGFVLLALPLLAAPFGRVPLPCDPGGALAPRSLAFCLAARNYVVPALRDDALAIAAEVRAHEPGATVSYLDAAFPFRGLPLLPHLSHGDGRRLGLPCGAPRRPRPPRAGAVRALQRIARRAAEACEPLGAASR